MIGKEAPMRIEKFSFGHITIDGVTYDHDVVIDHGKVRKRVKKPSKKLREAFAHTPLSPAEKTHGIAAGSSSGPARTATCPLRIM
jgi:hypothetical protein